MLNFNVLTRKFELAEEAVMKLDRITKPAHYYNNGKATVGPLEYADMHDLNKDQFGVVKYMTRADKKGDPIGDYRKARFHIDRLIADEEDKVDPVAPTVRQHNGPITRRHCNNAHIAFVAGHRRESDFGRRKGDMNFTFLPDCPRGDVG